MFGFNKWEKLFKGIQKGARVAIFGTGDAALTIKNELQKRRRDARLVCFLDSFKTGELEGIPILSPFEQGDLSELFDTAIVSSHSNAEQMELVLKNFNMRNFILAPLEILQPPSKRDRAKDEDFKKKIKESLKCLKEKEDRRLYKLLADIRLGKEEKRKKLGKYIENRNYKKFSGYSLGQYFDFVNKNAIKTAIDGGSHNGVHSLLFVRDFPNIQGVWAFEPLYERFKSEFFDKIIQNSCRINIIQKALWSGKTTLEFREIPSRKGASFVSDVHPSDTREHVCVQMQTTTLDSVVKENKIEKVDFIKLDVENSELEALEGAKKTILKDRPQLAVCIYHSDEHFCELPKYLSELLKEHNYTFRLGHYGKGKAETVLYAIPKELYERGKV